MNRLAKSTLESFERNVMCKLDRDDSIYVWVLEENGVPVEVNVNTLNHQPEGICCTVQDLDNIEDWWDHSWSYNV